MAMQYTQSKYVLNKERIRLEQIKGQLINPIHIKSINDEIEGIDSILKCINNISTINKAYGNQDYSLIPVEHINIQA